ncbi:hypothetical protein [Paractinoplanes toevensis]|uniref:Uncharacterized protein n=1 Tax=Paractinoplanes toevensis TaxID=571911 RepID=A0A919T7W6_9ACTN|nr:hypothetical protein [Actinoplanes toevensis]GIM89701.1 hypothetical protein Ato02nite_014940 [Actinoplanes toevensis]
MGTNYYLREHPCGSCGRSDELHVGKSSGGWSFGFRGYRHDPDDDRYSPTGYPVLSRDDWRKVFTDKPGRLVDEYGREVENPIEWLDALQPPDLKQQRWEGSNMGSYWRPDARDWRDTEGFRFYDGDFS